MGVPHSGVTRPAFVLLAGESLAVADGLRPARESKVLLRYGAAHQQISKDGATLTVAIELEDGTAHSLADLVVAPGLPGQRVNEVLLDIGAYVESPCRILLAAGAGPANDPKGDWIAIYEVAVASSEELPKVRARAFSEERARNELAHFAHVYEHQAYHGGASGVSQPAFDGACRTIAQLVQASGMQQAGPCDASASYPHPSEFGPELGDAFHYSHHLLTLQLSAIPPNFVDRLRLIGRDRTPRILSLCSGAARIEASFAATSGVDAEWTLMDISEPLLRSAAANFPSDTTPELIVGDLNHIHDYGRRYDIIICVSGLHHIVELESVMHFIRDALVEDGEFWSIGEAIGRNGNRLWPRDYEVANTFFRGLPDRLRRNRTSGIVDHELPDTDFSMSTFEGIRSEDIDRLLCRILEPVHLYRRNCFLWRIVDLAYADNYDLGEEEDVAWLQRAVSAEVSHFRAGGRPTELHGVFRRPAL